MNREPSAGRPRRVIPVLAALALAGAAMLAGAAPAQATAAPVQAIGAAAQAGPAPAAPAPQVTWYNIRSMATNMCVDVAWATTADNALTIQAGCWSPGANQRFQRVGTQLVAQHSGKCLAVMAARPGESVPVVQVGCNGSVEQQWTFVDTGFGPFFSEIRAAHSGKCLSVAGGSFDDLATIVQQTCQGSSIHQLWSLNGV